MALFQDDMLTALEHADVESLRSLLSKHDLIAFRASGLSIDQVLTAAALCQDPRLILACLEAGADIQNLIVDDLEDQHRLLFAIADVAAGNNHVEGLTCCLTQGVWPIHELSDLGVTAALKGHIAAFESLMSAGLDVNEDYAYRGNALICAVRTNRLLLVQFLVQNGATVNANRMLSYRYSTLSVCVHLGSVEILQVLLAHCATINNSLALHQAAACGRTEMIQCLLDAGADINENPTEDHDLTYPTGYGLGPPIHYAAEQRRLPIVKYLLDRGADAALLDQQGKTLIERSVKDGSIWQELLQLLRKRAIGCRASHRL